MNTVLFVIVDVFDGNFGNLHGVAVDADGMEHYLVSVGGSQPMPAGAILHNIRACKGAEVVYTNPDSQWDAWVKTPVEKVFGWSAWWEKVEMEWGN